MKNILDLFKIFVNTIWKVKFTFILLFWLLISLLNLLEPFIYSWLIKYIELNIDSWNYTFSYIVTYFIFWWIFILFTTICLYIFRYYFVDVSSLTFYKERFLYNSKIVLNLKYNEYLNNKSWSLFKNFDKWIDAHFRLFFEWLNVFLRYILSILVITIVLFIVNWKMSLAMLALYPFVLIIWYFFTIKTSWIQKDISDNWDKVFWIVWDAINNSMLFKLLNLEKSFYNKISIDIESVFKDQLKVSKYWSISDIYTTIVIMISRFFVFLLWIYLYINWEISFYILFLFLSFVWYIYFPTWLMLWMARMVQENIVYINKFYEQFSEKENDKIKKDYKKVEVKLTKSNNISFNKVSFSYIKDKQILNDISFQIEKWTKVALVWSTWSWKSTIVNLLLRLWDIDTWNILIWDKDIKDISKTSLRDFVGVVSQDNSLFNLTIKENLLFAKNDATEEELYKALKNAQAHFVFDLKDWLDTIIGERWLKLSWWEKQRISIARLFLKNPSVIILDEATSALDNKTEVLIQKALDKLMKWKTSIVIAHRLSTIQNSDNIYVLKDWSIVENWNYDELMNKKWYFYELSNPSHLIIN